MYKLIELKMNYNFFFINKSDKLFNTCNLGHYRRKILKLSFNVTLSSCLDEENGGEWEEKKGLCYNIFPYLGALLQKYYNMLIMLHKSHQFIY